MVTQLAEVRLAAAIAHSVPDCVVELSTPCGRSVCVGFRPVDGVSMTPCALRRALVLALPHHDDAGLARLLGLPPGGLTARIVGDEDDERQVGLGVFRHECADERGFVFATLLSPGRLERVVRAAVGEARVAGEAEALALDEAIVKTLHDPGIETTVVVVGYASAVPDGAEALALRLAAVCAVEELLDGSHADPDSTIG